MTVMPACVCDTHMHFYDSRWPVAPTTVLEPPDADISGYRRVQEALGLSRVVVVQPTTYGFDNGCQLEAMAALGDSARGVMVVGPSTSDDELAALTDRGVRGARFHMLPGGAVGWAALVDTAERVGRFGWHIQLQMNGRELSSHPELLPLADRLVIDHVGRFMPPVDVDAPEFGELVRLVDAGAHVKLSAPYESATDPQHVYEAVTACVDELVRRAPDRMLWATNWPHPGQDEPPSFDDLATLRDRWLPTAELRQRILVDNPARLYDF